MDRAYSRLEIKEVDEESRTITGIATTPSTDRMGDIVEPKGAVFSLPIPFLWQHDHLQPVGDVVSAKVTAKGIEVVIKLAQVLEMGPLRDRLEEAWLSIKAKLVRGLSIGFAPLDYEAIEGTWGQKYTKWEWLELSAVTIPANADASIQTIKSIDRKQVAALGKKSASKYRISAPGASGKLSGDTAKKTTKPQEGKNMNVQDQIKQYQSARAEKASQMEAIMSKSAETGETLDAEQSEQYDALSDEVGTIDKHLERLRTMEKAQLYKAAPVVTADASKPKEAEKSADNSRGGHVITLQKPLEKGIAFARFAGVLAHTKGNFRDAVDYAGSRFPEERGLKDVITMFANHGYEDLTKAAVAVGTTSGATWAAPLVQYNQMAEEFIEFLRPQTIIGQIPNLRRVPFNIAVPRQSGGGSASWVGEAAPKPVTAFAFDQVTMRWTKLATIAVISQELARFSQPSAETIIRDQLAKAIIQQGDLDFVNPANAGTANVKPAAITNGVTPVVSGGVTEAAVRKDIQALFAPFIAANLSPQNGVWIMSATTALALSLMVNALGQPSFPGINMSGGVFWGMPVVVSESVGNIVILANAQDIMLADDGQVTIDSSQEASLQMDNAPDSPATATTVMVSLWQNNLLGLRAERYINWIKARPASVQYLSGVAWGT